jgi:allophanate hydrolase
MQGSPDASAIALDFSSLRAAYQAGTLTPTELVRQLDLSIERKSLPGIWIHRVPGESLRHAARLIEGRQKAGADLPLYGIPFAVKDNIDVEGIPTTAACPDFTYTARRTATVVNRLVAAGALLIGKTNLDQFATGLVGTRSPYGIPVNPFDERRVAGGSSSGSAVAVARGEVSFALGTDTAGSGRVPAAFNNLVGLKPSCGVLSTHGLVPACRSLDCISVFALTCEDARLVAKVSAGYDAQDPYSRPEAGTVSWAERGVSPGFLFWVPRPEDVAAHCDEPTRRAFEIAVAHLEALGGRPRWIDLSPFFEAARLLYGGPWIAERLEGLEDFILQKPDALLPVTRGIFETGGIWKATELFTAQHRLEALKRSVSPLWENAAVLLLPTAPIFPRIDEVEADPVGLNTKLGAYTNFVNLLDLAAVAVPTGMRSDGLPSGATLVGPWGADAQLLSIASLLHRKSSDTIGATGKSLPEISPPSQAAAVDSIRVAVVGAHLSGEPLNHQLVSLGARLLRACKTAPRYRLYVLPATKPAKPGLVHSADGQPGFAIEIEVWELPRTAFGAFFSYVAAPLCIGTIEIEDGQKVPGFLCEAYAIAEAREISELGGWRAYRREQRG